MEKNNFDLELYGKLEKFIERVDNLTKIVEQNSKDISGLKKFKWMLLGALALASTGVFATVIKVFLVNS